MPVQPKGAATAHSLASRRLRLLYVPNATGRNKAEAGPCGRFEISWNGALVGHVSLVGRTRREAAIGYEIRLKYRRRGFASEAVAAVMSAAPGFGLSRVMAQCRSDNIASRGVLLKSGFALTSSVPWQTNGDSPLLFMGYRWIAPLV